MLVIEAVAAAMLGFAALWLVLRPLLHPAAPTPPIFEPVDSEETPKGMALAALKEIEFDRETGKLSDADYEMLKVKYTAAALHALRGEDDEVAELPRHAAGCPVCGPRPEPDAVFCSSCGRPLTRRVAA